MRRKKDMVRLDELEPVAPVLVSSGPRVTVRGMITKTLARLVLAWVCIVALSIYGRPDSLTRLTTHPAQAIFDRAGATLQMVEIVGWAEVESKAGTFAASGIMSSLKRVASRLALSIADASIWFLRSGQEGDRSWVSYSGDLGEERVVVIAQAFSSGERHEPYALVCWERSVGFRRGETLRSVARRALSPLRPLGGKVHQNLVLRGTVAKKPGDKEGFVRGTLFGSQVKVLKTQRWSNGVEIMAYDPRLPAGEWDETNANLGIRVEEMGGTTWIAVGTPRIRSVEQVVSQYRQMF